MKVGVHVPQWGSCASREAILSFAAKAEEAELDSVWVGDHIVFPAETSSDYPYLGEHPFQPEEGFLEALTTLAVLAGATDRVELGTSVLVLPMRPTLLTAKALATLDVLSNGRVALAVGAGWWAEEFEALGAPFEDRWAQLDAQIDSLVTLWRDGRDRREQGSLKYNEVVCEPRPRNRSIPLWIGGTSNAVLRRVAATGCGWHAVGSSPERLADGLKRLGEMAELAGRSLESIPVSTSMGFHADSVVAAQRMATLEALGVSQVVITIQGEELSDLISGLDRLATDVIPRISAAACSKPSGDRVRRRPA